MDIDQMMYDSLKYPLSSWGKVATLGAIMFLMIIIMGMGIGAAIFVNNMIVTAVILVLEAVIGLLAVSLYYGYLFKVLKSSLKGKDKLPKFKNFPKMMVNGLKVLVVNLAYGLVLALILGIFIGIMLLIGFLGGGWDSTSYMYAANASATTSFLMFWLYYVVYYIFLTVNMLLSILFSLVISIAIANMASQGKFGAAFDISEIREKLESIRWGKAIVWVFAINIITTVIMLLGLISVMLVVGFILLPLLIIPYLSIFEYRAIALLYKSA